MDNQTTQKIKDLIGSSANIGIAVGSNPTLDEMAGALSLYLALKNAGRNVVVASPTDPIVEVASLVGIDKVKKNLGDGSGGDLVVSFPYTEGEIEKVSYTLEEGALNIIVKASEQGLSFDERDVRYTRGGGSVDMVFVVGAARLSDVESLFDTQNPDTQTVNIDNKPENEGFGDIVLVSNRLSSISEGIADLTMALGLHIDEDAAQNLMSGITSATQNFQNPRTSALAFEMAALLLKKGAAREINQNARRGISLDNQALSENVRPQRINNPQHPGGHRRHQNKPQHHQARGNQNFEEKLQKRVQEEIAREQQVQKPQRQTQVQSRSQTHEDLQEQEDDQAPTDWLAPKVYKGSSEV